ncbi:MAG: hypothetical protein UCO57_09340 [Gemmiger sp.]|nr:hypothetical protein [Gemmiger sp.]MEE0708967.1 hypothetical protein [Gemmiger sp.]
MAAQAIKEITFVNILYLLFIEYISSISDVNAFWIIFPHSEGCTKRP